MLKTRRIPCRGDCTHTVSSRIVKRTGDKLTDSQHDNIRDLVANLERRIESLELQWASVQKRQYLRMPSFPGQPPETPFMSFSTCSAVDFLHPRYREICGLIRHPFQWHRKLWEWVFVIHHLLDSDIVKPNSKGLVFGVGHERLPALFASMGAKIIATDAPADLAERTGWIDTLEHISTLRDIRFTEIVDGAVFDMNVSYQICDMNDIPPELAEFDFNWSSCCFEHLGSLEAGIQFVINAVEKTLRVGGVAVHTTEFNLSSNDETLESGVTVIYRHRDLLELVQRLQARGHIVKPLIIAPESHYWDFHVDVPPYLEQPHLKLLLEKYVSTSVGIVVTRGK